MLRRLLIVTSQAKITVICTDPEQRTTIGELVVYVMTGGTFHPATKQHQRINGPVFEVAHTTWVANSYCCGNGVQGRISRDQVRIIGK